MIGKITKLLERFAPKPKVWFVMYCPVQGQFRVILSDHECEINRCLFEEGRFSEMGAGVIAGFADTEKGAMTMIPAIARTLGLRWSEKDMRWFTTDAEHGG
jgi:hypothetical protein